MPTPLSHPHCQCTLPLQILVWQLSCGFLVSQNLVKGFGTAPLEIPQCLNKTCSGEAVWLKLAYTGTVSETAFSISWFHSDYIPFEMAHGRADGDYLETSIIP